MSDRQLLEAKLRTPYTITISHFRSETNLNLQLRDGIYLIISPHPRCGELENNLYDYIDKFRSDHRQYSECHMALHIRTDIVREIMLYYYDEIMNL